MQKTLDITIRRQKRKNDCIPACMLMCFDYFYEVYGKSFIKNQPKVPLSLTEIYELVEYSQKQDNGTDITDEWAERVNKKLSGLVLNLRRDCTIYEFEDRIRKELPSIVLYPTFRINGLNAHQFSCYRFFENQDH